MLEKLNHVAPVRDPRAPGATFALGNIGWIDFETRSHVPISAGTDRYSRSAHAILLAWAIGDGPIHVEAVADFESGALRWDAMPAELREFYARAKIGAGIFCAHNAGFDRSIWNNSTYGFPPMDPRMMIDTAVQASASGLPRQLDLASRFARAGVLKDKRGKDLINLFTVPGATATPQTHGKEWQEFITYARNDIGAMRELFRHTRQLPWAEWEEFWVCEEINDYGVGIDIDMVTAAAEMAVADRMRSSHEISVLTEGYLNSVNKVQLMSAWLRDILPPEGRDMLVKQREEIDDEGLITKVGKWQLTRDRVVRLIAYLESFETLPALLAAALRVLQIRRYGGSKTPAKFARIRDSHVNGVIRGQYVFGGASQTGRFSAKGIQVHNLSRDTLDYELDAIDALLGGVSAHRFATLGDDAPISRKLALLIRPTLVAQPGNVFVWSDWANIEARITPWLADDEDAEKRLDVFRAVDADPSIPDVYTRTAAELSNIPIAAVDKKIRQRGKVVDLACGFGGSTNALLSMAASFGMHLPEEDAKIAVTRWREANPWAPRFWGRHDHRGSYGLWGAANSALEAPGEVFGAGRINYVFLKNYLGGSLLCQLPSGRWLTYRRIKWERVEEIDEDTNEIISVKQELMFSRDMGRIKLWPGLLAENVTQAAAADLLRGTLVRLSDPNFDDMPVVLHTHDEVVVECAEGMADDAAASLVFEMERGFEWTAGLPIKADATVARFYSKSPGSWGV